VLRGADAEGRQGEAGDARRTGMGDVAARRRPDQNSFAGPLFERKFLQKFE
jgi:hypothetical protein